MIQPFDLQTIFINIFAGNYTVFLFLAIAGIAYLAAKFRMNNYAFFTMIALFAIMMGIWIQWFYALIIVIFGMGLFFIIARIIKQ